MRRTTARSETPAAIRPTEEADDSLSNSGDNDADDVSIATVKDDEIDDSTSAEDTDVHGSTSAEEDSDIHDSLSTEGDDDDDSLSQAGGRHSEPKPQRKPRSKRSLKAYNANKPPKKSEDEAEINNLLNALWQRQDKEWTISRHHLGSFQHLCFRHKLSWGGNKAELYERVRPVVGHSSHRNAVKLRPSTYSSLTDREPIPSTMSFSTSTRPKRATQGGSGRS